MTDIEYLREAYKIAAWLSQDKHTQTGAIIVDSAGLIIAHGANHFPDGVQSSPERLERPTKYSWLEHAERNAIFHAVRRGICTAGMTMYAPWFACHDCGRAIIQAGITRIVGHDFEIFKTASHWHKSTEIADQMFREAGIDFKRIDAKIGEVKILFDGKIVEP